MKKIEVTTAQKVIIQYELASLRDRILAFLLDSLIMWSTIGLVAFIITQIALVWLNNIDLLRVLQSTVLSFIFLFYTLASEMITNGKTLGKMIMGLKVVKLNGGIPSADDYLMRWIFRWIDIYTSFGAVSALLISSGDKSQRLGGLLSNTAVVRLRGDYKIQLEDLESMFARTDEYEPKYPNVVQFTDLDMLNIKELMKRYVRKPNAAHKKLMNDTVNKLVEVLQLEQRPKHNMQFLQSVLKDYVILTR